MFGLSARKFPPTRTFSQIFTSYFEQNYQNCNLHVWRNVLEKRKKSLNYTICFVYFGLSGKMFRPIGELFSVGLSKIYCDCLEECFVKKMFWKSHFWTLCGKECFVKKMFWKSHFWTLCGKYLAGFSKRNSICPED